MFSFFKKQIKIFFRKQYLINKIKKYRNDYDEYRKHLYPLDKNYVTDLEYINLTNELKQINPNHKFLHNTFFHLRKICD